LQGIDKPLNTGRGCLQLLYNIYVAPTDYTALYNMRQYSYQGRTDHSGTARGPGVIRGLHGMPLVPFIGFFWCGRGHRGPMIPYCPGAP
ncbi:unnamed protein product, partial [Staurois parvus]